MDSTTLMTVSEKISRNEKGEISHGREVAEWCTGL